MMNQDSKIKCLGCGGEYAVKQLEKNTDSFHGVTTYCCPDKSCPSHTGDWRKRMLATKTSAGIMIHTGGELVS
ncbi:MAG: hypothetical protein HYT48_03085 [Candidatus Vogelbacteria bacterium]|nr:hypothetical protein [Candidatus Vogelbacteria bacterium]